MWLMTTKTKKKKVNLPTLHLWSTKLSRNKCVRPLVNFISGLAKLAFFLEQEAADWAEWPFLCLIDFFSPLLILLLYSLYRLTFFIRQHKQDSFVLSQQKHVYWCQPSIRGSRGACLAISPASCVRSVPAMITFCATCEPKCNSMFHTMRPLVWLSGFVTAGEARVKTESMETNPNWVREFLEHNLTVRT